MVEFLLSQNKPVILTNTFVKQWNALNKSSSNFWTFDYLLGRAPENIKGVHYNKNGYFGPLWRSSKLYSNFRGVSQNNVYVAKKYQKQQLLSQVSIILHLHLHY